MCYVVEADYLITTDAVDKPMEARLDCGILDYGKFNSIQFLFAHTSNIKES